MNTKTVEPIIWRTWEPVTPEDFPCLICRSGRQAIKKVVINDAYHLVLCGVCAALPVDEIMSQLFVKEERRV